MDRQSQLLASGRSTFRSLVLLPAFQILLDSMKDKVRNGSMAICGLFTTGGTARSPDVKFAYFSPQHLDDVWVYDGY